MDTPPAIDTDAIIWSAPERERAARPLLVLLHGYGSHEGDLFGMSPGLPLEPVIASLRGPLAESGGYAWWSRFPEGAAVQPEPDRADAGARAVLDWLDTLDYSSVALLGFSQGAACALQLNRLAPGRFASTVALSGFVAPGIRTGDAELERLRPPVFWGRGTADQVIPAEAIDRTTEWLPAHADAEIRIYEDLGHSISSPELRDLATFLREHQG
ncbi:MAG: dienelactone hydrolase family protein [Rhodoglobus sp.]